MLTPPPDAVRDWVLEDRGYVACPLDRYIGLHPITELSEEWSALASFKQVPVSSKASLLLAWPEAIRDPDGKHLRGPILISLDGGSSDQWGAPDVWHRRDGRQEPFGFLRRFEPSAVVKWVANLASGNTAWFTTDGRDLWQITTAPRPDRDGRLVFDLLGDVIAGTSSIH